MTRTSIMRAQHDRAEQLFDELFDSIDRFEAAGDGADAYPLSLCLAKIAGILRTHFAIEDEVLYPALIASRDRQAAVVARVFQREMGHLADQFERFLKRWGRSAEIAEAIPQFRYECDMMFSSLRERIDRENRELYPIADRDVAAGLDLRRASPPIPPFPDSGTHAPAPRRQSRPFEGFVLRDEPSA